MRFRLRFMFWGTIFVCCTTLMTIFAVFREIGVPVAARVETIHRNFKKTLKHTSILDGINLLTGKERAVSDHQNASKYDEWVAGKRRQRPVWVSNGSKRKNGTRLLHWQQFHADITENQMYSKNAPYMNELLESLATTEIENVGLFHGGSQLKLHVKLVDGNYAMLKPMRTPRSLVYNYNDQQPFWFDVERHNAEIAAFHLDRFFESVTYLGGSTVKDMNKKNRFKAFRMGMCDSAVCAQILNFRRSPPCAGRVLNITADIKMKTKDKDLLNTFFNKGGNTCFEGKCAPWFCNKDHPVCGRGEMLEVSLCVMIPFYHGNEDPILDRPNPWSHGVREARIWQEQNICDDILKNPANAEGRFLLDLVEQSIFDFLMLNYDRHHFHMLQKYSSKGFVVALDNGKGFGNPHLDDLTLLGPLAQCCILRDSTFRYLKKVNGSREKLSDHMRHTLVKDLIDPVIHEAHLEAIDRRLMKLLDLVGDCVDLYGEERVMVKGNLELPFPDTSAKMDM